MAQEESRENTSQLGKIGSLSFLGRASWRANLHAVGIGHNQGYYHTASEYFSGISNIQCLTRLFLFTNVCAVTDLGGIVYCERLLALDMTPNQSDLLSLLHADMMMRSGYGYPPSIKFDSRDRHLFETRLEVHLTDQQEATVGDESVTVGQFRFNIEVHLSSRCLSTVLLPRFSPTNRTTSTFRVPVNEVFARMKSEISPSSVQLADEVFSCAQQLHECLQTARGRPVAFIETAMSLVAQHTASLNASARDGLYQHQEDNVVWMMQQERRGISDALWMSTGLRVPSMDATLDPNDTMLMYSPILQIFSTARSSARNLTAAEE